MKKLLVLAAVLIGCYMAQAQTGLTATALPLAAKINANKTVYRDFTLYRYSADGVAYKEYYDNHGRWLHTILSYEEGHLAASVRDRVNSSYGDYSISWVDEIREPGQSPLYRVELKGYRNLLVVQVNDEDMEQEAEYEQ
jgi:hypothetical protein